MKNKKNTRPYSIGQKVWPGLAKLNEECGELIQVMGKIIAVGGSTGELHWDGTDLKKRFEEELADVLAAAEFVMEHNELDLAAISLRKNKKVLKFRIWQHGSRKA